MYPTPSYVAEQMAREYTRDRIRVAEAHRIARAARCARKCRDGETVATPFAPVRRWRGIFATRTTTA